MQIEPNIEVEISKDKDSAIVNLEITLNKNQNNPIYIVEVSIMEFLNIIQMNQKVLILMIC